MIENYIFDIVSDIFFIVFFSDGEKLNGRSTIIRERKKEIFRTNFVVAVKVKSKYQLHVFDQTNVLTVL